MGDLVLDYRFKAAGTANPDGSRAVTATHLTDVPGPGSTVMGDLTGAVELGPTSSASVNLTGLMSDRTRFYIRFVLRIDGPVTSRQDLLSTTHVPLSLYATPGPTSGEFHLAARVKVGTRQLGPDTSFRGPLSAGRWYVVDLTFDLDTLTLAVDGVVRSVFALAAGTFEATGGGTVVFGAAIDGTSRRLKGRIAAFQWFSGIPTEVEAELDERRNTPEWFVTRKLSEITVSLGELRGTVQHDGPARAFVLPFSAGEIHYREDLGSAREMHGAIRTYYRGGADRDALGFLTTDEIATSAVGGKRSLFERGGIYFSSATGAFAVLDQIYLAYENLGESGKWGFPTAPRQAIPGGFEQHFQKARFFYKTGTPNAHEVHGSILTCFLNTGGIAKWGYPVSDEFGIRKGASEIGRRSDFERATIYHSGAAGTHVVHGRVRDKYNDLDGPKGVLGFPTSDVADIAGVAGSSICKFEKGIIAVIDGDACVVRPFRLHVGRIDTKESESDVAGQNDLFVKIRLLVNGDSVHARRIPESGDLGPHNVRDIALTLPDVIRPDLHTTVTLVVDVWDNDAAFEGGDDHLGEVRITLNAANAWGFHDGPAHTASTGKVKSVQWSVKPDVDVASLTDKQLFWGVGNFSTPTITTREYAAAFRDVDSEPEWWDIADHLKNLYYNAAVKKGADGGNCHGMSIEAIYARKGRSLFGQPISEITSRSEVEDEINIKQIYQFGAEAIWWSLGEFVAGRTRNPKEVFKRSKRAAGDSRNPILSLADKGDYSGANHSILPVAWDDSGDPWIIKVSDPNFPQEIRELKVDPQDNTYVYDGGTVYRGGSSSGGRLMYTPYDAFDTQMRTPLWEAMALLLGGLVLLVGDTAEVEAITDGAGADLDATGQRAGARLAAGQSLDGFFVPTPALAGQGRTGVWVAKRGSSAAAARHVQSLAARASLGAATASMAAFNALPADPAARTLRRVLVDPKLSTLLGSDALSRLRRLADSTSATTRVAVKGTQAGKLELALKNGLSDVTISSDVVAAETRSVELLHEDEVLQTIALGGSRARQHRVVLSGRDGASKQSTSVVIEGLPVDARPRAATIELRPSLGSIDLLVPGFTGTLPLLVESPNAAGAVTQRRFNVPIESGARLRLSRAVGDGVLGVGRITNIAGPLSAMRIIRSS